MTKKELKNKLEETQEALYRLNNAASSLVQNALKNRDLDAIHHWDKERPSIGCLIKNR